MSRKDRYAEGYYPGHFNRGGWLPITFGKMEVSHGQICPGDVDGLLSAGV